MTEIFMTVLSMSITASLVIAAVCFLRLLLKGAPRVFSYALWLVVFVRLLCPFSPESDWGIIPPANISTESHFFAASDKLSETGEQNPENGAESGALGAREAAGNFGIDGKTAIQGLAVFWLVGCISLLLYGVVSYLRFMKSLKVCEKEAEIDNTHKGYPVVISENIRAPFVAGFFRPAIYLPRGLDKAQFGMVYEHEKMHVVRRDYLIKPITYLTVCIHWFNPFVWFAFHLMEKDMEISCDEAVLGKIGYEKNKDYARTLLYLSREHSWKPGCPIAFGENSVKARIKNAVRCGRTKRWIVVVSAVAVLGAAVLLFVNSRWNLVISLEEKGTVQSGAEDITIQGVPGTDSNSSMDEIIYLPEEKIEHMESIPEENNVTTDHYYFVGSQPLEQGEEPSSGQADAQKSEEEKGE